MVPNFEMINAYQLESLFEVVLLSHLSKQFKHVIIIFDSRPAPPEPAGGEQVD